MMNVLAYADDIVLLAPSLTAMQTLLDVLDINILLINMTCNTSKTVCMVFNPVCPQKVACDKFPAFLLSGQNLQFVDKFKYVGHIVHHRGVQWHYNEKLSNDTVPNHTTNHQALFIYNRTKIAG